MILIVSFVLVPRLAPWGEARMLRSLPRVGGRRFSVSHSLRSGLYRHRASGAPLGGHPPLRVEPGIDWRGGCSGEQPYMGVEGLLCVPQLTQWVVQISPLRGFSPVTTYFEEV